MSDQLYMLLRDAIQLFFGALVTIAGLRIAARTAALKAAVGPGVKGPTGEIIPLTTLATKTAAVVVPLAAVVVPLAAAVADIKAQTDGMKDELVRAVGQAEHARGKVEGKAEGGGP